MESDFIEIEIVNWDKYNPRGDVKRPSWFRLDNRLIESPDFHAWSGDHLKCLIYLFSQASQKNSAVIRVFPAHALRVCLIKERDLREAMQKLVFLNVIKIDDTRTSRARHADDTHLHATLQDRTEQNTTGQDKTPPSRKARTPSLGGPLASLPEFDSIADVVRERGITEAVQKSWLKAFPDSAWITSEVRKALAWEAANPTRKKIRFGAFMTNWMSRGWDARKTPLATGSRNYAADREAGNRAALGQYLASLPKETA